MMIRTHATQLLWRVSSASSASRASSSSSQDSAGDRPRLRSDVFAIEPQESTQ